MQLEKLLDKYSDTTYPPPAVFRLYSAIALLIVFQTITVSWIWHVADESSEIAAEVKRQAPLVYSNCS